MKAITMMVMTSLVTKSNSQLLAIIKLAIILISRIWHWAGFHLLPGNYVRDFLKQLQAAKTFKNFLGHKIKYEITIFTTRANTNSLLPKVPNPEIRPHPPSDLSSISESSLSLHGGLVPRPSVDT